jgi:cytochrome c oxidase assembly protein subunit 15
MLLKPAFFPRTEEQKREKERHVNKNLLMRILAIITALGSYLMLVLGALVTGTGSGQGCGNTWPVCQGQVLPDSPTLATIIEYSHRSVSGIVGFLILALTAWSFLSYRRDFRIKLFGFLSVFFVVLQGALGALTVVFEGTFTKFPLLALHFGFSLICFASVVLLAVRLFQINHEERDGERNGDSSAQSAITRGWQIAVWILTAYIYVVIYTGALVRHTNSTTGCGQQFPSCDTTYFPNFSSASGIQVLHRYAAASIWLVLLIFLVVVLRSLRERRDILLGSVTAFLLVTLQAATGVMIVLSGGSLAWGLVHTTIVSVLFAVLSYLCAQIGWPWQKQGQKKTIEQEKSKGLKAEYI